MALTLLKRESIDLAKWDECVRNSDTPSLYVKSWFLDVVTQGSWQGLILDGYRGVLPIFEKKKYGLKYNIPPFLAKENGPVLSSGDEADYIDFFNFLEKKFTHNQVLTTIDLCPAGWKKVSRQAQVLDISKVSYNRNVKRNIKNAINFGVEIKDVIDVDLASDFFTDYEPSQHLKKHKNLVSSLLNFVKQNGIGLIKGAYIDHKLVSIGFFVIDGDKMRFLLCASNDEGKKSTALFEILNQTIQNIDQNKVRYFDFAGSSLENIARRNLGFGAQSHQYFHYKRFRLNF